MTLKKVQIVQIIIFLSMTFLRPMIRFSWMRIGAQGAVRGDWLLSGQACMAATTRKLKWANLHNNSTSLLWCQQSCSGLETTIIHFLSFAHQLLVRMILATLLCVRQTKQQHWVINSNIRSIVRYILERDVHVHLCWFIASLNCFSWRNNNRS
jgi:hypothetical protein